MSASVPQRKGYFAGMRDAVFLEGDLGGLRERAATALERGLAFVEAVGDSFAELRALVALQANDASELVAEVESRQAEDGSLMPLGLAAGGALGFDSLYLRDPHSPLLGALEALAVLADARALAAPPVSRLEAWLRGVQGADGSWGGSFETGMIAGFLGKTRVVRPAVLEGAGAWLVENFSPDAVEGDWSTLAAYAHFFTNVHHDAADDVLQWCGRATEKAFRARRDEGLATTRILLYCEAAALPGASLEPTELLERILSEQGGDGGFAELSGAPPAGRVSQTIDALVAIPRLCQAF